MRRIEAAEMKLLRPLAGYTLYDHKTNDYIRREIRITGILDKIDEYRLNWLTHLQRFPQNFRNHTTTDHKEGEQLEDRGSVGASSCNCGDGTDQRVQSLMFMMMMMMMMTKLQIKEYGTQTEAIEDVCLLGDFHIAYFTAISGL